MNRELGTSHLSATLVLTLSLIAGPMFSRPTLCARQSEPSVAGKSEVTERPRYQIQLRLDFDALSYSGSERVRWTNLGDHPTSVLFFHLYSNLRVDQVPTLPLNTSSSNGSAEADEPRIEISEVRSVASAAPLAFSMDDQGTTLRINLRESVPLGGSTEVAITFKGSVPEIDPDETGLTTHVVKQVSAALRSEREIRRARDVNFRCRGVMLLGTAFPVLVVREGDEWRRKLEPSVGDIIFNEAADYEVTIETAPGVAVFTSGSERTPRSGSENTATFSTSALRDFAIIAGRNLRYEDANVGDTTVRSIFLAEHERVGKRMLRVAADALRIFASRFGPLPFKTISLAEAPLIAGLGSTEFSGLDVIASAFYVDFDAPAMRNLPEIIREQRPAVEQSLEWSVAHLIAHQWWGAAVGNDPAHDAVLDEALSGWSALLYYKETYGEQQAATVLTDQLLGVYRLYRTFGGEDMDAHRPTRDYRNSFQYAAIVMTKGALMFVELERLLGTEKFFAALRGYYQANLLEIAELEDLRGALIAEAAIEQRRTVARTFNRWLSSKRGDEDIAKPDQELAVSLGLPPRPGQQKNGSGNAFTAFARLGKFFWQQMTRIR
jgi:hypothetical protein